MTKWSLIWYCTILSTMFVVRFIYLKQRGNFLLINTIIHESFVSFPWWHCVEDFFLKVSVKGGIFLKRVVGLI